MQFNLEENFNNIEYYGIWNLHAKGEGPEIKLFRATPSTFRIIVDGKYKPVLTGGIYSVVDEKYESIFSQISNDQLTIQRTTIKDFQFNTEANNYIELKIVNTIDSKTMHTVDSSGLKIWHYQGAIFVSNNLKIVLSKAGAHELWFSPGFSLWGG